ncbi:hypothetical protein [Bacillus cereus]|nr:hypothetical protein [Bacillus cereus]
MSKVKPVYCTFLVDWWSIKSCIMLVVEATEKRITIIKGLHDSTWL